MGIAEDIKNAGFSNDPGLVYYVSAAQVAIPVRRLVVRVRGDASRYVTLVHQELQKEMPGASYVTVTPFAELVAQRMQPWRLGATMFAVFGALALVLAAVGLYAVVAYDVEQRSREVGVRIALGAPSTNVIMLVLRRATSLAAIGVGIGVIVSFVAAPRLAPLLFDVSPRDPLVYMTVVIAMIAVAVAASFVPAHRAARVDPNVALRSE